MPMVVAETWADVRLKLVLVAGRGRVFWYLIASASSWCWWDWLRGVWEQDLALTQVVQVDWCWLVRQTCHFVGYNSGLILNLYKFGCYLSVVTGSLVWSQCTDPTGTIIQQIKRGFPNFSLLKLLLLMFVEITRQHWSLFLILKSLFLLLICWTSPGRSCWSN